MAETSVALEERQLSPDIITAIEQLDCPDIAFGDKVDLLLVALGRRPATIIGAYSEAWNPGEQPSGADNSIEKYRVVAEKAGLTVLVGDSAIVDRNDGKQEFLADLYVGVDKESAERLKVGFESGDDRLIGTALGFPPTAVEAYANNETGVHVPNAADDPGVAFAEFRLSAGHFQEELAVAEEWARAVHAASPTIYEGFMHEKSGLTS